MWSRVNLTTRSRIALLIGQIIILFICVTYIQDQYINHILPDKEAKETFERTPCLLLSEKLSIDNGFFRKYRADFLISYNVNKTQFSRWVSGNGLDAVFTTDKDEQQAILDQFQPGLTYTCFYNPKKPQETVLVLRHNWLSTFPLIIPSIIFLITLYYFFLNLFIMITIHKETE